MAFFEHNIEIPNENTFKSIIKVIGVGGGGSNAVKHMHLMEIKGADLIICNTDAQALASNPVKNKLQLGTELTKGLGAGTDPEQGRQAAIESKDKIEELLLGGTEMLFITAGMGGGTGTGAAPEIAKIAKAKGILTVAVVTAPYSWEGTDKINSAYQGIAELKTTCDTVLVVLNDNLLEVYKNLKRREAFAKADDVLANAVKSVVDVIAKPGEVNTDFMDVKKVLTDAGQAMMSSAGGKGDERALKAISSALQSPLLNSQDIAGAKRILVTVATSEDYDLEMTEQIVITDYITKQIGQAPAMFKLGFSVDEKLGDELYLTVIAAGFESNEEIPIPVIIPPDDKKNKKETKTEEVVTEVIKTESKEEVTEAEVIEIVSEVTEEKFFDPSLIYKPEDDSLRLRKMIDAFCQRMPQESDLEAPAYARYKVPLVDISKIPAEDLIENPL